MNRIIKSIGCALVMAAAGFATSANAALAPLATYNGNYGVSTDGWGGTSNAGVISASVPAGATVVAAYLYTATFFNNATPTTVTLDGSPITYEQTYLNPSTPLGSHRADVTSIVQSAVGGGGGVFDFNIAEGANGGSINGNALVVVYTHPSLPEATVSILDGFSVVGGDSTSINFADPLDPSDPGFFAEMYLGISHSCCNQSSNVEVNGQLMTENAGGFDDGEDLANGSLITVGSFDDDFSPTDPTYEEDTEKYDLTPFVNVGDTTIAIETENPSADDDIFLAVFYVSGIAGVNEPPPPPTNEIPVPAAVWLFGAGLAGLGAAARRRRKA